MNRSVPILAVLSAAFLAAAIAFFLQAKGLKKELAELKAAPPPAAPPAPVAEDHTADKKAVEAAEAKSGELEEKVKNLTAKLDESEKALAAANAKKADPKNPGKRPAPSPELQAIIEKLQKTFLHGGDIPDDAVKDLGLTDAQVEAIKRAMKNEEQRFDEAMRRFYADNVDRNEGGLETRTGKDLMMLALTKKSDEMADIYKLTPEQNLAIHSTSSLEEILGDDKFLSKMAREVHGVRLKTYEDLAMSLTPEQLAKVRDTYLREGSMYYKGMPTEWGIAPKDMKK